MRGQRLWTPTLSSSGGTSGVNVTRRSGCSCRCSSGWVARRSRGKRKFVGLRKGSSGGSESQKRIDSGQGSSQGTPRNPTSPASCTTPRTRVAISQKRLQQPWLAARITAVVFEGGPRGKKVDSESQSGCYFPAMPSSKAGNWKRSAAPSFKPVDFLKVAHHGSHNGTPLELLDRLLPVKRKAQAQVLVSTKKKVYGTKNPVPDDALLAELKSRCRKLVTTDGATGTSVALSL
jgi:hypothetical protein